jgi:hypothetical protein
LVRTPASRSELPDALLRALVPLLVVPAVPDVPLVLPVVPVALWPAPVPVPLVMLASACTFNLSRMPVIAV